MSGGVIDIQRRGTFTLHEVNRLLPVVKKITQEYRQLVDGLILRLESLKPEQSEETTPTENEINHLIRNWHAKIRKLGGHPKGLWLVDFDSGDGYFCWKFPEPEVIYWHGYEDGFTKRVLVGPCQ